MNSVFKIVSNLIELTKQGLIEWKYNESFASGHECSCDAEIKGVRVEIDRDYEAILFRYSYSLYVDGTLMKKPPKEILKTLISLIYVDFKVKKSEKFIKSIKVLETI